MTCASHFVEFFDDFCNTFISSWICSMNCRVKRKEKIWKYHIKMIAYKIMARNVTSRSVGTWANFINVREKFVFKLLKTAVVLSCAEPKSNTSTQSISIARALLHCNPIATQVIFSKGKACQSVKVSYHSIWTKSTWSGKLGPLWGINKLVQIFVSDCDTILLARLFHLMRTVQLLNRLCFDAGLRTSRQVMNATTFR